MRNYGNCKDCNKVLGDYYSVRCKTCSNRIIASKKVGTHLSETIKVKISQSVKIFAKENPDKIFFKKGHKINLGRKYSIERNSKISGVKHYNWKGGVTSKNVLLRHSQEYKNWRKAVFERDNYICVSCGITGNTAYLNADHIKSWAVYPKLRFEISNGRTLCVSCHEKTESYKNRFYAQAVY